MTHQISNTISKRHFLQSIGMIGGSTAVYAAMHGLGMAHASSMTSPPKVNNDGEGKSVIILGGGIAGMVSALELSKKGYKCEILEARAFSGGRCQTARNGTIIEETAGETQVCRFDNKQYLNIGPWRIPAEHKATLHYCNTLGVKLEPFINKSPQAYYYSDKIDGPLNGKPIRQIEAEIDRAGNIAELLAKSTLAGKLDENFNIDDQERLIEHLRGTGLLDSKELNYRANRARGFEEYPGNGVDMGKLSEPYDFKELLKLKVGTMYDLADHPPVMFQPVGGMDQIAIAMQNNLPHDTIKHNAEVIKIIQNEDDVEITYIDTKSKAEKAARADYCISTIPIPIVTRTENNFNPELLDALKTAGSGPGLKLGLQMTSRFWEKEEMIYGGMSYSDNKDTMMTAYPSSDLHGNSGGIILGIYATFGDAVRVSNKSIDERNEIALTIGEKLHPEKFRKYYSGKAISKAWHKDKYALGAGSGWISPRSMTKNLPPILKGDKRVLFAGDSYSFFNNAWMTGAIESAWHTIVELDKRVVSVGD